MANKKISQLTSLPIVQDSTILPVVDGGSSYKTTMLGIKTYIGSVSSTEISNAIANVTWANLSGKPTIPTSLLDLGITDGTAGQVLSSDGDGTFSFVSSVGDSTGNWGFLNNTMYNLSGGEINNGDTVSGSTSGLLLPANGNTTIRASLFNYYGNIQLQVANLGNSPTITSWEFSEDGKLTLPEGGDIVDSFGTSVLSGAVSGYSDSDVAAYLPTYTGDIKAGNANLGNLTTSTYFSGTLTTNAQPNITSTGTLTRLDVAGNVVVGGGAGGNITGANVISANTVTTSTLTASGVVMLGSVSTLHISGGSPDSVLKTDGAGNLSWTAGGGGGTSNTGDITFNNNIIQGDGQVQIAPAAGDVLTEKMFRFRTGDQDSHLHIDTAQNANYDLYLGDDSKYVRVAKDGQIVVGVDNAFEYDETSGKRWTFNTDGSLTLPADTATIRTNQGNLTLQSANNVFVKSATGDFEWIFNSAGALTTPNGDLTIGVSTPRSSVGILGKPDVPVAFYSRDSDLSLGGIIVVDYRQHSGYVSGSGTEWYFNVLKADFSDADTAILVGDTIEAQDDSTNYAIISGAVVDGATISLPLYWLIPIGSTEKTFTAVRFTRTTINTWTFDTSGIVTFPGAEGYRAKFGAISSQGDVLQTINNLHIKSESEVNITSDSETSGGRQWTFGTDGKLKLPYDGDIVDNNGTSVLGGGSSASTEITNTDGTSTYSVSVATTGVISMNTGRGGIEFGAMPEIGGPSHLHIMRPAGQNGSTDLYFGDDYNYVKLPGLYGSNPDSQQGVEIGSSLSEGTVHKWKFGTDGNLTLPAGGDIKDITGTSILGGGGTTLPADASGYLNNDGSGTLTWVAGNPAGSGILPYSDVKVFSATATGVDWQAYTLSGTMDSFNDYQGTIATITLSAQATYGAQIASGSKELWINDAKIDNQNYVVVDFPATPALGDAFNVVINSSVATVNAGSLVIGQTYTIASVGTTNWTTYGASYNGVGAVFVATGAGTGTGTVTTSVGAQKAIYKVPTGHRARTMQQGNSPAVWFGQGGTYDFMYADLSGSTSSGLLTFVYAGLIESIPSWYQVYF